MKKSTRRYRFSSSLYVGRPVLIYLSLAGVLCGMLGSGANSWAETEKIAITGEAAVGAPAGVVYSWLQSPAINDAGQSAFQSTLAGPGVNRENDDGFWSEGSGSLKLAARAGQPALGANSGVFFYTINNTSSLGYALINDLGQTSFAGVLTGAGVNSSNVHGLWIESAGTLSLVARSGSSAPGVDSGVVFGSSFHGRSMNSTGQVSFFNSLVGNGVDLSNNQGVWSNGSGMLSLIAREGDPAPGLGGDVMFGEFGYTSISDTGHTTFFNMLAGPGVTSSNDRSIWSDRGGTVSLRVREGDSAPGLGGMVLERFYAMPTFNDVGDFVLNIQLAGEGVTASNQHSLWSEKAGNLSLVARDGDTAPGAGTGVVFKYVGSGQINNAGHVTFSSGLSGEGVNSSNDRGIWSARSGVISLVTRTGERAAGTDAVFKSFSFFDINDSGQIAFNASLDGMNGDRGIWITDGEDTVKVARRFESLEGRIISHVTVSTEFGDADGRFSSLNNFGQVSYLANFTNGDRGIFLFTPDLKYRRATSGNWDDADNWTLSIRPGRVHDVAIASETDLTVHGPAVNTTVESLTIGGGAGKTNLFLQQGVNLIAHEGLTLLDNGLLSGSGSVTGHVAVTEGATISPGNSPGVFSQIGTQTWASGGNYNWQLLDAAGSAGTGFDQIQIDGELIVTASSHNPFAINLWTLASIGPDVDGAALNFDPSLDYSWDILTTTGGILGFDETLFELFIISSNGTGGFVNPLAGGHFSLRQAGNDLVLDFNARSVAMPEPTTSAMTMLGLGVMALRRRRRLRIER